MALNVLVTGACGQLGQALKRFSNGSPYQFYFLSYQDLDITKIDQVKSFFQKNKIDFCINAAAYTAVDQAENDKLNAFAANVQGVRNLARICQDYNAALIHLSTDFVFDGTSRKPYTERDTPKPLNLYGLSKLQGENAALELCEKTIIIRTSWLYSPNGNNFVKTMLNLSEKRKNIQVVQDQIGTPTCANELANAILDILSNLFMNPERQVWGIYHYANEGVASWYDFAYAIFRLADRDVNLQPVNTESFPRPAQRPAYSVMDKTKIKKTFGLQIEHWHVALRKCLTWDQEI